MRAFKPGMGPTLLALLAVTGCGQTEREPQAGRTSAQGLQSGPDFVITAVSGPASVQQGQSFTAQVTVCNQGTQSDSTEVELYLSADATIRVNTPSTPEDKLVGSAYVPTLVPGQCTTLPLSGTAYPPAPNPPKQDQGFYLGAVVDPRNSRPELREDNNTFTGKRMGVGSAADFVVTAISGPASAQQGQSITAQVTVCNQGTQSDSTEVELYLSADTTIRFDTSSGPPEDYRVAGVYVPTLFPGQCTTLPLSGTAYPPPTPTGPSSERGFYLGAAVDPRNSRPELLKDNNTFTGKRMGLGSGADFVVTAVSGPASAQQGQSFTAQVTVCNQGTQGDSTEVELYLSADTTIRFDTSSGPPEDSRVAGTYVPTLAPGQCTTLPLSGTAYPPPTSGSPPSDRGFYLGAVVDPRNSRPELLEDNNTFTGKRMGVGSGADFIVTAISGPASVQQGQSITAQVTVCNQGTQSDSAEVELYLSADTTIRFDTFSGPPEDYRVAGVYVPTLFPGQCTTLPLSGTAYPPPTPTGPSSERGFYLGAVVDPRNSRPELLEDNNAFTGKRMGLGYGPDFVVTAVSGPASAQPGQSITAQVTVCNQGTQSDSAEVELYLSADTTIRADTFSGPPEDSRIAGTYAPTLAPGQCTTLPLSGQAYPPPSSSSGGNTAYYLGAVVDPRNSRPELLEDNNAFTGKRMGVGSGPDFVVTAVSGPASAQPGQSITVQVTVCNQGTQSASTEVELYLSADTTIRADTFSGPPEDYRVTGAPVSTLVPGQCTTLPLSGQAYPPPTPAGPSSERGFYLGAVVDPRNSRPELLEDNNTFTGKRMGLGSGADFVVTAVSGPASVQQGQSITAQVTVCNQGTQSDSAEVELYLSADTTIRFDTSAGPPEDYRVTGVYVPTLVPGQCTTLPLSGQAYPPPSGNPNGDGKYYLGAVVDPRNSRPELLEDNNTTLGNVIVIR